MPQKIELSLYVNGLNSQSNQLYSRLSKYCTDMFADGYTLNLHDLKKDRGLIETDEILVTPTLIRNYPPPRLRVSGNLNKIEKVMHLLQLTVSD